MTTVRCPDCGAGVLVPAGIGPGDLVECPGCAGHALRLRREGDGWVASLAHRVSCPTCDRLIALPEGAGAGDEIECGGRSHRLTFAHGAFAADEVTAAGASGDRGR